MINLFIAPPGSGLTKRCNFLKFYEESLLPGLCLTKTAGITPIRDEVKNRHRGLHTNVRPRHIVLWVDILRADEYHILKTTL